MTSSVHRTRRVPDGEPPGTRGATEVKREVRRMGKGLEEGKKEVPSCYREP